MARLFQQPIENDRAALERKSTDDLINLARSKPNSTRNHLILEILTERLRHLREKNATIQQQNIDQPKGDASQVRGIEHDVAANTQSVFDGELASTELFELARQYTLDDMGLHVPAELIEIDGMVMHYVPRSPSPVVGYRLSEHKSQSPETDSQNSRRSKFKPKMRRTQK